MVQKSLKQVAKSTLRALYIFFTVSVTVLFTVYGYHTKLLKEGEVVVLKSGATLVKVFSYELPELQGLQIKLTNSQFSTENIVHRQIVLSKFHTRNVHEADFFFVPLYPMGVVYKYKKASESDRRSMYRSVRKFITYSENFDCISVSHCKRHRYQAAVLNYTISLLKYWNVVDEGGSRHIFIFPGGNQQNMFPNWIYLINNSIHLLVEGHYGAYTQDESKRKLERDRVLKDIIIPGGGDLSILQKLPRLKRSIFISYCGNTFSSMERRTVSSFLEVLRERSAGSKQRNTAIDFKSNCSNLRFLTMMRKSKYCLTPAGNTPWTSRMYGAIAQGCVPVLFNTNVFVPPFRMIPAFDKVAVRINISQGVQEMVDVFTSNNYDESVLHLHEYSHFFHINYSLPHTMRELARIKDSKQVEHMHMK